MQRIMACLPCTGIGIGAPPAIVLRSDFGLAFTLCKPNQVLRKIPTKDFKGLSFGKLA